ncbi:MAG: glycosyltransferase family 2 protein [Terracidiphilus sp.]
MQPSKTCVILVSFHGASDTSACVHSLLASTVPVKIIIVDTSPNDPELGAALTFAPSVTILSASENVGFGRGNNLGIDWALEHTSCDFIFLLNNDAVIYPESISCLEASIATNTEVGIMTPRIAYLDAPEKLWYGGGEVDWRRAGPVTPGFNQSAHAALAMTERDVTFASGCALFVRSSVIRQLGGFDPRFFMYEEDVEFCLRASEMGILIRYIPRSVILHKGQGSDPGASRGQQNLWSVSNARLPFFAFHIVRNRLLNVYLHAHGKNLLTAGVFFPLFIVRRAIPLVLGGRMDAVGAMFKGMADFWRIRRSCGAAG